MNWNQALSFEMVVPRMSCNLIIVGETKEGMPFCYEDSFVLQKVEEQQLVATMEFHTMNPLEKLHTCALSNSRSVNVEFFTTRSLIFSMWRPNVMSVL